MKQKNKSKCSRVDEALPKNECCKQPVAHAYSGEACHPGAYSGPCEDMPKNYNPASFNKEAITNIVSPTTFARGRSGSSRPHGFFMGAGCDPALAAGKKRAGTDIWRDRYLLLQAEMIDDARRWFSRIENLLSAHTEQLREMRLEAEEALQEGFEEAYQTLIASHQRTEELVAENKQLRDRIRELEAQADKRLETAIREM